jgi:hypothetical protein
MSMAGFARKSDITPGSVSYEVQRGEKMVKEPDYLMEA